MPHHREKLNRQGRRAECNKTLADVDYDDFLREQALEEAYPPFCLATRISTDQAVVPPDFWLRRGVPSALRLPEELNFDPADNSA